LYVWQKSIFKTVPHSINIIIAIAKKLDPVYV